jgi:hypothetical protein
MRIVNASRFLTAYRDGRRPHKNRRIALLILLIFPSDFLPYSVSIVSSLVGLAPGAVGGKFIPQSSIGTGLPPLPHFFAEFVCRSDVFKSY